ncbi:MAG: PCRF domain-containing protein [Candidatus Pacebacteria bacterium]|jgi:peptide chain release factor 1|nr:PCRF domain-containing protein [Candidatus Paceibacterota bacterium]MBT4652715.1 PCRF domain-containing protein [Candidatus Paceibacterota bacterium]MBT6755872.1 PCRF domain-containing protein [Candidatus Paceibacterota bacterium]MBT6921085.1 PCRF domain-containing protein [Candidatus Paceibacterota bacterium]
MKNPYAQQISQLEEKIAENNTLINDPELGELAKLEITDLESQKKMLEEAAEDLSQNSQDSAKETDTSKSNAILEIRGGAGGDEAKIWANDLMRMYIRFIESVDMKAEYIDDLVIKIRGKVTIGEEKIHAYDFFKYESGVHRVQRVPSTESQGRIHTSTASVAVLPEVKENAVIIRDEDLDWQFMRAGGAGGQSVNKTSSAVRLTHKPTGIVVNSRQERKQVQNRQIALELLRSQMWEIEEEKKQAELGNARKAIGRNMRAEKIRTYNYPQNRITDHRITVSWHSLEDTLDGNILKMLTDIRENMEKEEDSE